MPALPGLGRLGLTGVRQHSLSSHSSLIPPSYPPHHHCGSDKCVLKYNSDVAHLVPGPPCNLAVVDRPDCDNGFSFRFASVLSLVPASQVV